MTTTTVLTEARQQRAEAATIASKALHGSTFVGPTPPEGGAKAVIRVAEWIVGHPGPPDEDGDDETGDPEQPDATSEEPPATYEPGPAFASILSRVSGGAR